MLPERIPSVPRNENLRGNTTGTPPARLSSWVNANINPASTPRSDCWRYLVISSDFLLLILGTRSTGFLSETSNRMYYRPFGIFQVRGMLLCANHGQRVRRLSPQLEHSMAKVYALHADRYINHIPSKLISCYHKTDIQYTFATRSRSWSAPSQVVFTLALTGALHMPRWLATGNGQRYNRCNKEIAGRRVWSQGKRVQHLPKDKFPNIWASDNKVERL